mmetsp:Transcript_26883/g.32592  ORF Transcript_26883/g.32592 Transcript_26883/m.32592 type:complete len:394 (-) Transcript_26883:58-1239(-)
MRVTAMIRTGARLANVNGGQILKHSSHPAQLPIAAEKTAFTMNTIRGSTFESNRYFSSKSGKNDDNNDNNSNNNNNNKNAEDPFGVTYQDGPENLGPNLPPRYKRDPLTGKLTGDTETELSPDDKKLLQMTDDERIQQLSSRIDTAWSNDDYLTNAADRIRREETALNVVGRSPKHANTSRPVVEGGVPPASAPLTEDEFGAFRGYLRQTRKDGEKFDLPARGKDVSREDIRVDAASSSETGADFDPDQDLARWLPAATGKKEDSWMEDIMPADLSPVKKVNRREAKLIPKELLHHNNLELLRRYVTPGGQILNRVNSRLGAKDQRKIAKMIKRARAMGLIPHVGQWKLVDEGDRINDDLERLHEWEIELERRGLSAYKDIGAASSDREKKSS